MSNIFISLLGKFDLVAEGTSILPYIGNSSKSILLLKYLILSKNKPIPVTDLIDTFWPESDKSQNPENALKTMVSRIRTSAAKVSPIMKNCILSENKAYRWNPNIPCDVDVFQFESLCFELQKHNGGCTEELRGRYIQMLDLYSGDLSYSNAEESWLLSRSLYLHHLYLQAVNRFIEILKSEGDYETIIHVCRIALDIDTFDERLNLEMMNALKEGGQNNMALMQYRNVAYAYYKYLGIEPSEKILGFYKDLINADFSTETDINFILQNLQNIDNDDKALVCDYSIFRNIYQLQLRNLERHENKIFLALLTIRQLSDTSVDPFVLDNIMHSLLSTLEECLRKGDTVSRYSATQYAILLPMISHTSGHTVIGRIKKTFYKKCPDKTVTLLFQFGGIDKKIQSL